MLYTLHYVQVGILTIFSFISVNVWKFWKFGLSIVPKRSWKKTWKIEYIILLWHLFFLKVTKDVCLDTERPTSILSDNAFRRDSLIFCPLIYFVHKKVTIIAWTVSKVNLTHQVIESSSFQDFFNLKRIKGTVEKSSKERKKSAMKRDTENFDFLSFGRRERRLCNKKGFIDITSLSRWKFWIFLCEFFIEIWNIFFTRNRWFKRWCNLKIK